MLVLPHDLLRVVWAVERLAVRVVPGARVVAPDDEVRAAVVLANDRVPDGLARSAHPHGEVEERERRGLLGVLGEHGLVAAHARVVVDIAGLGQADDRMYQQVRLVLPGSTEGELLVGTMQGIARLERDDLAPAELAELRAQLCRRVAQPAEIVMGRRFHAV